MARDCYRSNLPCFIFLLLALVQLWSNEFAEGRNYAAKKTIMSDGDVIDCVDIYKQPAFNDPLLSKHKKEMKRMHSLHQRGLEAKNSSTNLFQSWQKYGECPLGTIPILRTPKLFGSFNASSESSNDQLTKEFAIVSLPVARYLGARADVNLWQPFVDNSPSEYSISKVNVKAGPQDNVNSIQSGWLVQGGDNRSRFYIAWTRDSFKTTGCHNLDCPGFVQGNSKFVIGGGFDNVATYGGPQYLWKITIKKDPNTGAWVLFVGDDYVGYWPNYLFTDLHDAASTASFGGEIGNTNPGSHHTKTQMGSGNFAGFGYGKAAYQAHIGYIDEGTDFKDATTVDAYVTKESCYNLNILNNDQMGLNIFFGGPGLSNDCP